MIVNMGGSLTPHSENFIRKLFKKNYLIELKQGMLL